MKTRASSPIREGRHNYPRKIYVKTCKGCGESFQGRQEHVACSKECERKARSQSARNRAKAKP